MLVITNAKAGTTDAENVRRAVDALRAGGTEEVTVVPCAEPDQLDKLLAEHDATTVVAAGGDGSIHALVRALHRRGELDRRTVGLLPLGTGNDLARNLGIPLDPGEAARLLLTGRPRELDLLVDDGDDIAVNAVHVGVGAAAAAAATRFKPYLKTAAFPVGAVLAGIRHPGWRLRVEADGETVADDRVLMVALSNAPAIAGGAGRLAPGASPRDGLLDLVVSAATGPVARVGYALGLRDGTHQHRADVVRRTATRVTVRGEPFPINSDGEVSGPVEHRTWTVSPRAWRIVAPPVT
ncbi:lipid kinase [Actinomadura craniellae]|uniref:Lipid kinase n=1 Tax=Actinomadura craniellae TaxID=2231787 RepID=A0A365HC59_9ACTN|nr:diacylglycerol kinase family protein [Actinomadura craniellae]RAY16710.1 lipid kinase [Actinomadura craniellae]